MSELKKIVEETKELLDGWEYFNRVLKGAGYEPTNIVRPEDLMLKITSPTSKRRGKLTLSIPDEIFQFTPKEKIGDVKKFNHGKFQVLVMFVKKVKEQKVE
jgi:hypothetical protein